MSKAMVKEKANLPANVNLEELAGAGMETVSVKDMSIPFLKILQTLSPEVKKSKAEYIEGAEEGDICNSVTGELYKSVNIIPCFYQHIVNEWKPNRGGFVGTHPDSSPVVATAERVSDGKGGTYLQAKSGNILVDTANWYVLIQTKDGDWTWGILACSSTAMKKSRKLMTVLQSIKMEGKNGQFTPPLYSHIIEATTVQESNDKGDFFNWKFELSDVKTFTNEGLFNLAKSYFEQVKSGMVKATPMTEESTLSDVI